eukprot:1272471-Rhodomonas_salina.1
MRGMQVVVSDIVLVILSMLGAGLRIGIASGGAGVRSRSHDVGVTHGRSVQHIAFPFPTLTIGLDFGIVCVGGE